MAVSVRDLMNRQPITQLLVYGPPGSGKTTWAARSPLPFYVLTEMQGLGSVYVQNQDAPIEAVKDFKHFASLLRALKRGAPCKLDNGQPAFTFKFPLDSDTTEYGATIEYVIQTLVIDSISHVHKQLAQAYPHPKEKGEVDFFRVQRVMAQLLDDLRSLPVSLICVALEDRVFAKAKRGKEKKLIAIQPMLFGKIATSAGQYFAGVAYANKYEHIDDDGNDKVRYRLSWSMPQHIQSKTPPCVERDFPPYTVQEHRIPGVTTLGSMLQAMYPEQLTASLPGDRAEHVWNE